MASRVSTAQPVDAEFTRAFTQRWVAAWNSHDETALLSMCAEDVIWDDPALEEVAHGREEVRQFLRGIWRTFPDLSFALPEAPFVALEGPRAAQPWRMSGTMRGPDPSGFAPTGRRVDQPGIDLYEFRDGLVARYRALYDIAESGRQMGLIPARGSRAERFGILMQRLGSRLRRS